MKIVHVLTNLGAGGIEHFVTQASICQTAWHKVSVVALRHPGQPHGRAADHKRMLEEAGIEVHVLQAQGGMGLFAMALALRRLLRRIAPDVVNAHSHRAVLLRALTGGNIAGGAGKWIYTHHTAPLLIRPALFRLLDICVTRYIANSGAGAQTLMAYTRKPVTVVYHGVIFPDKMPLPCRPDKGAGFVVTTVGSLRDEKRHDRIPKIAAYLREKNPELFARTVFQIVGDGPHAADLHRDIALLGLQDHVQLLGERSDVLALLRGSDAFLLTSDFEGVPISLVEAGWAGLPIVSADAGACGEVFEDGCEGYLIAIEDIGGYASALERLAISPKLRQDMSQVAQGIPARFDMNSCIQSTNTIYQAAHSSYDTKAV